MAGVGAVQQDGFSFTWTIQNFSYCAGASLTSPTFKAIETSNVKWCLIIYPKRVCGSHTIELKLKHITFQIYSVEAIFELSVCAPTGIFELEENFPRLFYPISEHGIITTIRPKDMCNEGSAVNINNDSLTVRCKILKMYKNSVALGQCHARTIIVIERDSCVWNIPNFIDDFYNKWPKKEPIVFLEKSAFTMEITSSGRSLAEEKILIEIKPVYLVSQCCLFSTCKMSLIGIDGKIVYSVRDEHRFESNNAQVWKVSLIPMNKLLNNKELYLPNGTLTLRCEFAVSSGATYSEVSTNDCEIADLSLLENLEHEKDLDVPSSLKDNLKCFYTDKKFSDISIQTPNKEFSVHKTILCARSAVFSAMFESDTKEKLTGVIDIKDIDDDTISKMLLFLYTDSVGEDLEFETAFTLYSAANKYGIDALKKNCADFLKDNFTVTNICDVLVLADMHQDQDLKSSVQKFIFGHSGEIIKSEEWKNLMKNKLQLASETMQLFIQNLNL